MESEPTQLFKNVIAAPRANSKGLSTTQIFTQMKSLKMVRKQQTAPAFILMLFLQRKLNLTAFCSSSTNELLQVLGYFKALMKRRSAEHEIVKKIQTVFPAIFASCVLLVCNVLLLYLTVETS